MVSSWFVMRSDNTRLASIISQCLNNTGESAVPNAQFTSHCERVVTDTNMASLYKHTCSQTPPPLGQNNVIEAVGDFHQNSLSQSDAMLSSSNVNHPRTGGEVTEVSLHERSNEWSQQSYPRALTVCNKSSDLTVSGPLWNAPSSG